MRATKLVLLLSLFIFNSCRSKDPQANLLIGAWKLVGSKLVAETAWKISDPNFDQNVVFWEHGIISTGESSLFSGGWCNKAERYLVKERKVIFSFGEPGCIPLVDPQIPAEVTIVDLTQQLLVLQWGSLMLKLERVTL